MGATIGGAVRSFVDLVSREAHAIALCIRTRAIERLLRPPDEVVRGEIVPLAV